MFGQSGSHEGYSPKSKGITRKKSLISPIDSLPANPNTIFTLATLSTAMFSMLVLSPTAATTTDVKATVLANSSYAEVQVMDIKVKAQILTPESVKSIINATFPDNPLMAKIAFCESGLKQYNDDGSLMRGWLTPADVGVMQINEGYHGERAKALGIDIHTIEGNLKYAGLLYNEQGAQPWSASKPCWSKM